MDKIIIDGCSLSLEGIVQVARKGCGVKVAPAVYERLEANRQSIEKLVQAGHHIYGINTGFGEAADKIIPHKDLLILQKALILSHATCVGRPLPEETVRAMMLLRANTLARGYSGVRPVLLERVVDLINNNVYPYVPEQGSVGASGDLGPGAHVALVMLGFGKAWYQGELMTGKEVLAKLNLEPLVLQFKEGLALVNGTQLMTAIGALTVYDSEILFKTADVIAAMTLDALRGKDVAFRDDVQQLRPHRGQIESASNVRAAIEGSELIAGPTEMVQDAYSLRCIPQVHGASRDAFHYVKRTIETEINSVTDNPVVFTETGESVSMGHFHGQPLAVSLDVLGIALAEMANISERRVQRLTEPFFSMGLPACLSPLEDENPGLYNGFSMAHETAGSLVSENKVLAHPSCVDSIPGTQEDHVSMGATSARKAQQILGNVEYCLAVELLCAAQALDFRLPKKFGKGSRAAYDVVRKYITKLVEDRELHDDMIQARDLIKSGEVLQAVESVLSQELL
ncbi:MAG: histidine ammonia-lyase [Anaerolineales bacterium]|nr:histidine ammonia-lyase [Anaerolineales bacterium]